MTHGWVGIGTSKERAMEQRDFHADGGKDSGVMGGTVLSPHSALATDSHNGRRGGGGGAGVGGMGGERLGRERDCVCNPREINHCSLSLHYRVKAALHFCTTGKHLIAPWRTEGFANWMFFRKL